MSQTEASIESKAKSLRQVLSIKTRRLKLKSYKNCFTGSDAIQKLIELKLAKDITQAVEFGNQLIISNIIEHVDKQIAFKNQTLFYRFTDSFYSRHLKTDYFEHIGSKLKSKNNKQTISNSTKYWQTAYGSSIADCTLSTDVYTWKVKIEKLATGGSVCIGIEAADTLIMKNNLGNVVNVHN